MAIVGVPVGGHSRSGEPTGRRLTRLVGAALKRLGKYLERPCRTLNRYRPWLPKIDPAGIERVLHFFPRADAVGWYAHRPQRVAPMLSGDGTCPNPLSDHFADCMRKIVRANPRPELDDRLPRPTIYKQASERLPSRSPAMRPWEQHGRLAAGSCRRSRSARSKPKA